MSNAVVFCRIGWMDDYKGSGQARWGGEPDSGYAERWNFLDQGGVCYGHVETKHDGGANLARLAGRWTSEGDMDDVTVVWFAKSPNGLGQVVVGWYDRATACADREFVARPGEDLEQPYEFRCAVGDAHQFPVEKRTFRIPRGKGFTGQSNLWYADGVEGIELVGNLRKFLARAK